MLTIATHCNVSLSNLVLSWLYSGYTHRYKANLSSDIFMLNCHAAATTSLFVEKFLNLCFKSQKFGLYLRSEFGF